MRPSDFLQAGISERNEWGGYEFIPSFRSVI